MAGVLDKSEALIIDPSTGEGAVKFQTEMLSAEEAKLLRDYKRFLQRRGLREALFCNTCSEQRRSDGTQAYVTAEQIGIKCRCRFLFHQGPTA